MTTNEDENAANAFKLHNIFFKHLNKTGKHRVHEATADNEAARRTSDAVNSLVTDRWRRLPIWNIRRLQMNNDNWLNNLERNQQQQQSRYIDNTEDYN